MKQLTETFNTPCFSVPSVVKNNQPQRTRRYTEKKLNVGDKI